MTNKQRKEHKIGNQLRKKIHLALVDDKKGKKVHSWNTDGFIQNGKYS